MKTEIILDIIIILIGLYLALFKSYFQEKGKNIATSEDIEGLTLKVESVKQQFLEKNANLKAKLDLFTNLQLGHKNDERQALISFHKKISQWIGLLTESSVPLIDDYDNEEIKMKYYHYDNTYSDVLSAQALLRIYVEDQELKGIIDELKIKTLENLAQHPSDFLTNLRFNNLDFESLKLETNMLERGAKRTELLEKRKEIYATYRKNMVESLKVNIVFEENYTKHMREYIKSITIE
jgi:hypothetical protein